MNYSQKIKTIGIIFNLKKQGVSSDQYEEYDEIETIRVLEQEISKYGFKVIQLEQDEKFLTRILKDKPDFVFNIAEGIGNTRSRESQVPCILESLGIPYFGSDPISMGLTLDKYLTNIILKSAGIPVPSMFMVKQEKEVKLLEHIFKGDKSYVVKPRWEGSSKGIFLNSRVTNLEELRARVRNIISKYKQPALVEEFLEKDEITVGVYGNESIRVLGMMKISPKCRAGKYFLYGIENKRNWQTKIKYEPEQTISPKVRALIKKYAIGAYQTLELKDIARIDFRLDHRNNPKIIDINPLPGLSPFYSDLPILYKLKGGTYSNLIRIVLKESFKRYGFDSKMILKLK